MTDSKKGKYIKIFFEGVVEISLYCVFYKFPVYYYIQHIVVTYNFFFKYNLKTLLKDREYCVFLSFLYIIIFPVYYFLTHTHIYIYMSQREEVK